MRKSQDELIRAVQLAAQQESSETIGIGKFRNATGVRDSEWEYYWGKWPLFLEAAGLKPGVYVKRLDDTQVLAQIVQYIDETGEWPQERPCRIYSRSHPGFPAWTTIRNRGDRPTLARKLLSQIEGKPKYENVRSICLAQLESNPKSKPEAENQIIGHVYLQKHEGRRYKIGKANSPHQRAQEIGIMLPYAIVLVHSIPSVAPSALERYWHLRFADKKIAGTNEFFELDAVDVAAFKGRKDDF